MNLQRATAAVVESPNGNSIVIVSVHFKCCGYDSSREDGIRIKEANDLVAQLGRLRNGEFGDAIRNAGVIVVGDYNLVGSRRPLSILESAGLTERPVRGQSDKTAVTWRGRPRESFWQGRLDAVTYDPSALTPANGFVLNTARMSREQLEQFGVKADDSSVSDHLLLVADFVIE